MGKVIGFETCVKVIERMVKEIFIGVDNKGRKAQEIHRAVINQLAAKDREKRWAPCIRRYHHRGFDPIDPKPPQFSDVPKSKDGKAGLDPSAKGGPKQSRSLT